MMATTCDYVSDLAQKLRCKHDDTRFRVAMELKRVIHTDLKEETSISFNRSLEQLLHDFKMLIQSNDLNDKKAALMGIGCLMELDSLSVHNIVSQFERLIMDMVVSSDLTTTVMHARLLALFGLMAASQEFVFRQISIACDRLVDDNSSEAVKVFSVLTLRETALHTPNSFFKRLNYFTEAICIGLRDKQVIVRDLCGLTLRAVFSVIAEREVGRRRERSPYFLEFAIEMLRPLQAPTGSTNVSGQGNALQVTSPLSVSPDGVNVNGTSNSAPTAHSYNVSVGDVLKRRKLTFEEKAHGFLILLQEILLLANKTYEKTRRQVEELAGQTQAYFSSLSDVLRVVTQVRCPLTQNQENLFKQRAGFFSSFTCESIISDNFDAICNLFSQCIQARRYPLLTPLILQILPRLAALRPQLFSLIKYSPSPAEYPSDCLKNNKEKPLVFQCIGFMAYWLKEELVETNYVSRWIELVHQHLPTVKDSKRRSPPLEVSLLMCISLLAECYREQIHHEINGCLDNMLVTGLSQPLTQCLKMVSQFIPSLKKSIHDGLLKSITMVLENRSNSHSHHHSKSSSGSGTGTSSGLVGVLGGLGSGLQNWVGSSPHSAPTSTPLVYPSFTPISSQTCAMLSLGLSVTPSASTVMISTHYLSGSVHSTLSTVVPINTSVSGTQSAGVGSPSTGLIRLDAGTQAAGIHFTPEHAAICQALRTLGNFEFECSTNHLIRHTADHYISHEVKEIRLEAIRCLSFLMLPLLKATVRYYEAGPTSQNIVSEILNKLLMAATSDPEPEVRMCVLQSLSQKFDPHLTQASQLDSLFLILQDEVFEIRELTLRILGRLSALNPACVQPSLRRVLLQILTEMDHSGTARHREQAARILATLISTAPRFIRPYAEPLMITLLPKILPVLQNSFFMHPTASTPMSSKIPKAGGNEGDVNSALAFLPPMGSIPGVFSSLASSSISPAVDGVSSNIVQTTANSNLGTISLPPPDPVLISVVGAIGELAKVAGGPLKKYLPQLMPILYNMLQDANSYDKRKMAIHVLCQLITNTGFVVRPYEENPRLLRHLLQMLKTEEAKSIRSEVIKSLGLLGALDPLKFKIYSGVVDCVSDTSLALSVHDVVGKKEVEMSQSELLVSGNWSTTEEFLAASAMSALLGVLREPSLRNQYKNAVEAIIKVFQVLGRNTVPYLKQVMPEYLRCMRESTDLSLKGYMLQQLKIILRTVKLHIHEFMHGIVEIVLQNWETNEQMSYDCTRLLQAMIEALHSELKPHLTRLMPCLLRQLTVSSFDRAKLKLLKIIPDMGYCLEEYLHMFIPAITRLLDQEQGAIAPISNSTASQSTPNYQQSTWSSGTGLRSQIASFNVSPQKITLAAINCLARLADTQHGIGDYAGRIVQPVCRLLDRQVLNNEQQQAAMDLLTSLMAHTGRKFEILIPLVLRTMHRGKIQHPKFANALHKVSKGVLWRLSEDDLSLFKSNATIHQEKRVKDFEEVDADSVVGQTANSVSLERSWRINSKIVSRDDWMEWLKNFSNALVRNSPSAAIRACFVLCEVTPSVAKILYNAAFVSSWPQLSFQQQDDLVSSLEHVLTNCDLTEVTQTILNLAEFMSHFYKGKRPIRISLLSNRALTNRAYAKALYYNEQEFLDLVESRGQASQEILSSLLTINNKLQLQETSNAVLDYATKSRLKLQNEASWYEKLQNYSKARHLYELKLDEERTKESNKSLIIGRMRCLKALGEWQTLNNIAAEQWRSSDDDPSFREKVALLGAHTAWTTNEWQKMSNYTMSISQDSYEGAYLKAVLAVHDDKYDDALSWVEKARDMLDADLTAMAGESYNRAYDDLICAQKLAEIEEVVQYKLIPDRREVLRQSWYDRLMGCQSVVEDWHNFLKIRQLVLTPLENVRSWLKFAGLCRRSDRLGICQNVLTDLLGYDYNEVPIETGLTSPHPQIVLALCKLLWNKGDEAEATQRLSVHIEHILKPDLAILESKSLSCMSKQVTERKILLAKCCLKLGTWFTKLRLPSPSPSSHPAVAFSYDASSRAGNAGFDSSLQQLSLSSQHSLKENITPELWGNRQAYVIRCYRTATEQAPGMQKAWQNWAMANYAVIHHQKMRLQSLATKEVELHSFITQSNLLYSSPAQLPNQAAMQGGYLNVPPLYRHPLLQQQMIQQQQLQSIAPAVVIKPDVPDAIGEFANQLEHGSDESGITMRPVGDASSRMDNASPGPPVDGYLNNTSGYFESNNVTDTSGGLPNVQGLPMPMFEDSSGNYTQTSPSHSLQHAVKANFQYNLTKLLEQKQMLQNSMERHAIPAVRGFVNAISLSPRENLQDSLRLITLLFEFGHMSEIREVIREGLHKISLENWLLVIQQLLARIDTTKEHVAGMIVDLLISVGKKHAQAMINPLVLAFKSGGSDRRRYNANKILYSMEEHSPRLVSEGFMLNEEMIRLAITWLEMWFECLEDACRVYYIEQNVYKMIKLLHPLHVIMKRGPETLSETSFHQEYMPDLYNAEQWSLRFLRTGNQKDMHQSWETYYSILKKLPRQVNNINMLELTCASPRLANHGSDWILAIPGSYEPFKPVVSITGLNNSITFMMTKQKPKRVSFTGSNGHNYMFLLKGHEDIRQDERVMQFFGLANSLLLKNPETLRRNLTIQRMSVIPLSTNTGLIGWVPDSDTLHSLIKDYRDKNKIILNQEHRAMMKATPDYEKLNLMQRTEVFEYGLSETDGRDLANILWTKSPSSEAWLEHRTNFIRSMATMSMIGYILGLGDRHPSNLMLSRQSGKVIHIDFGDCFEVAMIREKYPEKVPFRLTRMIINAMEVTGIDGLFRQTCEQVMSIMRSNSDSLLAVLEAFIHDPLLQWVLLENRKDINDKKMLMHHRPQAQPAPQQAIVPPHNMLTGHQPVPDLMTTQQQQQIAVQIAHQQAVIQQIGNGGRDAPAGAATAATNNIPAQLKHPAMGGNGPLEQLQQAANTAVMNQNAHDQQQQQHVNPSRAAAPLPPHPNTSAAPSGRRVAQASRNTDGVPSGRNLRVAALSRNMMPANGAKVARSEDGSALLLIDSASLRDPRNVNPWRHHLCNGPWLGSYAIAKKMRRQRENGTIVVERDGLQGFIFSAKPQSDDRNHNEEDRDESSSINTRARDVMTRIRNKLNGQEMATSEPLIVSEQVKYLIQQATSNMSLCQMYIGWCPFW